MSTTLVVLAVASQLTYYQAKVPTFGCNSAEEVSELRSIRPDKKAFSAALAEKKAYGQCIEILQGTVVEGTIETDESILRVNMQIDPPGYQVPREDFELKALDQKP